MDDRLATESDAATDFDRREDERRAQRIAAYDRIAEWRAERVAEHHYYSEELRGLVSTLVLPGSRILEVGCGLGDLLAVLDGPVRVGIDLSLQDDRACDPASPGASISGSPTPSAGRCRRVRSTRSS